MFFTMSERCPIPCATLNMSANNLKSVYDKNIDSTKFKFAGEHFNKAKMMDFVLDRVELIMGKGDMLVYTSILSISHYVFEILSL